MSRATLITTSCPCGWRFEVPDRRIGHDAVCPACGRNLMIENGRSLERSAPSMPAVEDPRVAGLGQGICPFCHSEIPGKPLKCRHCGEWLDPHLRKMHLPIGWHPGGAAIMSFFVPGLGQIYKGQVGRGFLWLVAVLLGYALFVVPGLVGHILCVNNAYYAENPRERR